MAWVEVQNVRKVYRRDTQEIPVLDGSLARHRRGRVRRAHGAFGQRQDDAAQPDRRHRPAHLGRHHRRGHRTSRSLHGGALARWRSQTIGFIFQLYNLMPVLTALQNVELPLLLLKMSGAERRKRAEFALDLVGLGDRRGHYPRQLSGGQEQRVAIARALVSDPKVLLADEPTGDLDRKSGEEVLQLLERLNREFKKTIVMVTHDPHAAERAHRMVHLDKGVLTALTGRRDRHVPARDGQPVPQPPAHRCSRSPACWWRCSCTARSAPSSTRCRRPRTPAAASGSRRATRSRSPTSCPTPTRTASGRSRA